jgi:hypothetical protein
MSNHKKSNHVNHQHLVAREVCKVHIIPDQKIAKLRRHCIHIQSHTFPFVESSRPRWKFAFVRMRKFSCSFDKNLGERFVERIKGVDYSFGSWNCYQYCFLTSITHLIKKLWKALEASASSNSMVLVHRLII